MIGNHESNVYPVNCCLESKIEFVAFVPFYFGNAGSDVNEYQLVYHLCKTLEKIASCKVFAQVRPTEFLRFITTPYAYRQEIERRKMPATVIPVPVLPGNPVFFLRILSSILISTLIALFLRLKLSTSNKILLIYTRDSWNAIGFFIFTSAKIKVMVKIQSLYEDELKRDLLPSITSCLVNICDKIALRKATYIGVPSLLFLKNLETLRRSSAWGRVLIVPPGIDDDKIQKIRHICSRQNKTHRLQFIIGYIGLLEWWQGVETLVMAIDKVNKMTKYDLELIIIGDGPLRGRIENLCRMLGIKYCITGFIPHEDALCKLAKCDLLVVPRAKTSTTESIIPLKVIESWALGIPVITTKHAIYEESNLKDSVVFCEPEPCYLSSVILKVLTDEIFRSRIVSKGCQLVHQFRYAVIAQNILKEFLTGVSSE